MLLAVLALAVFYLTYVVTRSTLPPMLWARTAIMRRWPKSWAAKLVTCPWCMSFWVALVVVSIAAQLVDVPLPAAVLLACAGVTGVMQFVVDAIDAGLDELGRRG